MSGRIIIHTEASPGWGGQEIRTLSECLWMRDHGYTIHPLASGKSAIHKRFQEAGFATHHVPFVKRSQIRDFFTCRRIMDELKPHAGCSHSNIDTRIALLAARQKGIPHRIRYRHVSIPVKPSLWNNHIYRRCATRIITTATAIGDPLRRDFGLTAECVQTIFTGVDPPGRLPTRGEARTMLAAELGLPADTHFVGQVSVLRRWKGHEDVMRAFDSIAGDFPNHHLVFVGGGPGENYLPPIAKALPCASRIHFTGHREDPWPLFRALDVATLASTEGEGIPQSTLQAMFCETPFLGTRIGGIPEIITDRESGLLVPPASPDALASALRTLLDDPGLAAQLAQRALAWAQENASRDIMGAKLLRILET